MCKEKKVVFQLIPFEPMGIIVPQLSPLVLNVMVPRYIDRMFLITELNYYYQFLPTEMSNENKLVYLQRYLQSVINRRFQN